MSSAPERIWVGPNDYNGKIEGGIEAGDGPDEYIHKAHSDALIAAAYQVAASTTTCAERADAAMSYRHDFGLLPASEQETIISTAGWWHEAWKERTFALTPTYARAAYDAAIAEAFQQGRDSVKVKPLVWVDNSHGFEHAETLLGHYVVWDADDGGYLRTPFDTSGGFRVADDIIGAKSFAQADYERRIREALDEGPAK